MDVQNRIAVFLAEFDFQVDQISRIYKQLKDKLPRLGNMPVSAETVESAGYWLHNLYCAFEELFQRVAVFWENNVSSSGEYHINLLKRMLVEIKGIRPPLLSEKSYHYLNELRGFRHAFRHAYSYGLDDERVVHLLRKILKTKVQITKDLTKFRALTSQLEQPEYPTE